MSATAKIATPHNVGSEHSKIKTTDPHKDNIQSMESGEIKTFIKVEILYNV